MLSAAALVIACLCCVGQGVLLALQQAGPTASAEALARQLEERLQAGRLALQSYEAAWARIQAGEAVPCAGLSVDTPPVFVIRPDEERRYPQLTEAAVQLNHALDRLQWSLKKWQKVCAQPAPDAQTIAEGVADVEEARQALQSAESALLTARSG